MTILDDAPSINCAARQHGPHGVDRAVVAARLLLASLLLATAAWKILAFNYSADSVNRAILLTRGWHATAIIVMVISVEVMLAAFLYFDIFIRASLLSAAWMSTVACGMHVMMLWQGELQPCGCTGRVLKAVEGYEHHLTLALAIAMLFLATFAYCADPRTGKR